ncbi:MAG TPA: prevent-host-death protein [Vicinamibacteria bacterium]|nr:prevent-host-death protein [Vicinamibacteria bacterium]
MKGKGDRARETPPEYGSSRRLSATEASRNFSEIMNRVKYRGETFVIERGGEPICEVRPATPSRFTGADLAALLRSLPRVDDDYLDTLEELTRSQDRVPESPWKR